MMKKNSDNHVGGDTATSGKTHTNRVLTAVGHPIRRQIMDELTRRGYGRVSDLSEALEVPANKISFHVRTLSNAGLIRLLPDKGRDRRDRVWAPIPSPSTWEGPVGVRLDSVADNDLGDLLVHHHGVARRVSSWAASEAGASETGVGSSFGRHGVINQKKICATENQFFAALGQIEKIFDEINVKSDPEDPQSRSWDISLAAANHLI